MYIQNRIKNLSDPQQYSPSINIRLVNLVYSIGTGTYLKNNTGMLCKQNAVLRIIENKMSTLA
jgi:hypothetical protein